MTLSKLTTVTRLYQRRFGFTRRVALRHAVIIHIRNGWPTEGI